MTAAAGDLAARIGRLRAGGAGTFAEAPAGGRPRIGLVEPVDPIAGLVGVAMLREALDAVEGRLVGQARDAGESWAAIAAALAVGERTIYRRYNRSAATDSA